MRTANLTCMPDKRGEYNRCSRSEPRPEPDTSSLRGKAVRCKRDELAKPFVAIRTVSSRILFRCQDFTYASGQSTLKPVTREFEADIESCGRAHHSLLSGPRAKTSANSADVDLRLRWQA
jgi:hypothetical protein